MGEICKNSPKVWFLLVFTFETGKKWILAFLPAVLHHRENWRLLSEPHQLLALTGAKPGLSSLVSPPGSEKGELPVSEDQSVASGPEGRRTLWPSPWLTQLQWLYSSLRAQPIVYVEAQLLPAFKKKMWTVHFWNSVWMSQALSTTGRQISKMDIASPCLDVELSGP